MRQGTAREELIRLARTSPITPDGDWLRNHYLYQPATILAKTLYLNELYQRVLMLPGSVFEFGVWWGANLSLFANLRTVHEPHNRARMVVGFDTFTGYPEPTEGDRSSDYMHEGLYDVGSGYQAHLESVLTALEHESGAVDSYELVAGKVEETLPRYLNENPQCFVALAYIDLQTYAGTKAALTGIKSRLLPGSVVAFDELTAKDYRGESVAFREVFGDMRYTIERSRFLPDRSIVTVS